MGLWLKRFTILVFISFLSYCSYLFPIFENWDLSKYEGEGHSLYFVKVLDNRGLNHVVRSIYGGDSVVVVLDVELKIGSVVSLYGEVKDGRLIVEKYHAHEHPWMPYYLSSFGFPILIFILNRKWRFDFQSICFRRR